MFVGERQGPEGGASLCKQSGTGLGWVFVRPSEGWHGPWWGLGQPILGGSCLQVAHVAPCRQAAQGTLAGGLGAWPHGSPA